MDQASADPTSQRTRRQWLVRGTGVLAGVVAAGTIARPTLAVAADGGSVILGAINVESAATAIDNSRDGDTALNCNSTGAGVGLSAISPSGPGVRGIGGATGVFGLSTSGEGVYGQSGNQMSGLSSTANGVHGITDSASGVGVVGENTAGGTGVAGASSSGGDGVTGTSDTGRGVVGVTGSGKGVFGQRGDTGPAATLVDQHGVHGVTDSVFGNAVYGEHVGIGTAVRGSSKGGAGVVGNTTGAGAGGMFSSDSGTGAQASSGTGKGVWGISGDTGTKFLESANGVHGLTGSTPDSAVLGEHAAGGPGVTGLTAGTAAAVHGHNSGTGGIGVLGDCPAGTGVSAAGKTALKVAGPAVFSRSGKLTIKAGHTSATKSGVALTSASLVLVTPQNDVTGTAIRSAVPNLTAGSFTVHLARAVAHQVTIAWFIVN